MNKAEMHYFEEEDIIHLAISEDPEASSVEISPNITAELNEKGELIGLKYSVLANMYVTRYLKQFRLKYFILLILNRGRDFKLKFICNQLNPNK